MHLHNGDKLKIKQWNLNNSYLETYWKKCRKIYIVLVLCEILFSIPLNFSYKKVQYNRSYATVVKDMVKDELEVWKWKLKPINTKFGVCMVLYFLYSKKY